MSDHNFYKHKSLPFGLTSSSTKEVLLNSSIYFFQKKPSTKLFSSKIRLLGRRVNQGSTIITITTCQLTRSTCHRVRRRRQQYQPPAALNSSSSNNNSQTVQTASRNTTSENQDPWETDRKPYLYPVSWGRLWSQVIHTLAQEETPILDRRQMLGKTKVRSTGSSLSKSNFVLWKR